LTQVGIRASGCRTAQVRSRICARHFLATSITRRAQANDSRAAYFTPWRGSVRNWTGSNCSFPDSSGSRRSYLRSAQRVLMRNGCSDRANQLMKFSESQIISAAPRECESTIISPAPRATSTNVVTSSCKICSPESTRRFATALCK